MNPTQEQERELFQRDLDALPDNGTLTLMPREYPGPVILGHAMAIDGQGSTVWALNGPAISCEADGITLRNLRIEVTGWTETDRAEDRCALKVSPGCGITFDNVEVRGAVIGLWQEEGEWHIPNSLAIGSVPFNSEVDLLVRLWVPVACEITSKISGVLVQPQKLEAGANEITLHVERIPKDTLLNGALTISTANLKRRITVSGYISGDKPKKPRSKKAATQVAWEPDDWQRLAALPRPAAPTPPAPVPPPPPSRRIPPPLPTLPSPILPPPPGPQPPVPPPAPQPPVPVPGPPPPIPPPGPQPPVPQPGPSAQPPGPRPAPKLFLKIAALGFGGVLLLAVIGAALWFFFSGTSKLDLEKIVALQQLHFDTESEALAVAFSRDGQTVAGGSKYGAIQLWTVATGKAAPEQLPSRHEGAVNSLAFAHSTNLLASGSSDSNVILWDLDQKGQIKGRARLADEVNSVAFSPDDAILACGSKDGTVRFLDTKNAQQQNIKLTHGSPVKAVAFSSDGKLVATGAEDGTVKIWESGTGAMKQQLSPKHAGAVMALAFANNDPNILATASADTKLLLWDLQKGLKSPSPFMHRDQVAAVAFSLDDKIIVTGGDTTIRFWSVEDASQPKKVKVDHSGAVNAVAISSRGVVASGSSDKTVRLWGTP